MVCANGLGIQYRRQINQDIHISPQSNIAKSTMNVDQDTALLDTDDIEEHE